MGFMQDARQRRMLAPRGSSGSSRKRSGSRGTGAGSGGSSVKLSADDLKHAATVMEVSQCSSTGVPVSSTPVQSAHVAAHTMMLCEGGSR